MVINNGYYRYDFVIINNDIYILLTLIVIYLY